MKKSHTRAFAVLCIVLAFVAACTSRRLTTLDPGTLLSPDTKFVLGSVSNEAGAKFEFDHAAVFREELEKHLQIPNLLGKPGDRGVVVLNAHLTEYEPGSAAKRWLVPGWGPTKLTIISDMVRDGAVVGKVEARHTVNAGGLATIGAYRSVFGMVAAITADEVMEEVNNAKRLASPH